MTTLSQAKQPSIVFFKSIGISNEHQTGNVNFDKQVYIISDSASLHQQISKSETLMQTSLELLRSSGLLNLSVKKIVHRSGRLWVEVKTYAGASESSALKSATNIVPKLVSIRDQLDHLNETSKSSWKDSFTLKAALILGVSSGLATYGIVSFVKNMFLETGFIIQWFSLLTTSFLIALALIVALVILTLHLLNRSSRTHFVLIELFLVGTLGATASVYFTAKDINSHFDTSPASLYVVPTSRKYISRSRRGGTTHYVYVQDWTKQNNTRKLKVSSSFYRQINVGDNIEVQQKSGYLGYHWVADFRRVRN